MYITRICTGTCMHCTGMQLDCSGTATSLSHLNIVPVQKLCTYTVCFCDRFVTCSSVTFFIDAYCNSSLGVGGCDMSD